MYRFYLPTLLTEPPDNLQLPQDQSHHATRVLRLTPGTPIILFDGQGHHAPALIQLPDHQITRLPDRLPLKLTAPITTDPPPTPALTIAVAVPKADRADWLIEQASQLNVTKIQWLATDRAIVKPREGSQKLEKHHRLAIESAKQCTRTHLLQIAPPITLDKLFGVQPSGCLSSFDKILWLDPNPQSQPIHYSPLPIHHSLLALIGPEGGWSPREHDLLNPLIAANKITRIRLTPTILRIETAAAALAAIIMCSESSL